MTRDTVLLVTTSYDLAAAHVEAALVRAGAPAFRLDTDRFPADVRGTVNEHGEFTISSTPLSVASNDVRAVWYRRHASPALPANVAQAHVEFAEREARAFLTGALLCLDDNVKWVSHPAALWTAEKKLWGVKTSIRLLSARSDGGARRERELR